MSTSGFQGAEHALLPPIVEDSNGQRNGERSWCSSTTSSSGSDSGYSSNGSSIDFSGKTITSGQKEVAAASLKL